MCALVWAGAGCRTRPFWRCCGWLPGVHSCLLLKSGPCAVVVSSVDDRAIMASCLQLGAADFLIKPLRANELRNLWARVYWWRRVRPLGSSEPAAEVRRPDGGAVAATRRGGGALGVTRGSDCRPGWSRVCGARASAVGDENILGSRKLEVSAGRRRQPWRA